MNIFQCILSVAAASAATVATAAELPFRDGEKIAFLGDSITELGTKNPLGYVNLVMDGLAAAGLEVTAAPAGKSGHTSKNMLARVNRDVISKKPDWMFLSCGVNDAPNGIDNPGIPLEDYKANICSILDRCAKAKIKVIILTATPVVEEPEHVANKNLVAYNETLRAIAAERKLPLVDLSKRFNAFIDKKADKSVRLLTVDGTHMSPYGDILMAYTILQQLGLKPEILHACSTKWLEKKDGWITKMNLSLSVREMEQIKAVLPSGFTLEQWVNSVVREEIKRNPGPAAGK